MARANAGGVPVTVEVRDSEQVSGDYNSTLDAIAFNDAVVLDIEHGSFRFYRLN